MIIGRQRLGTARQTGMFRHRRLVLLLGATVVLGAACSPATSSQTPVASPPSAASTAPTTAAASEIGSAVSSSASPTTTPATTPASTTPAPSKPTSSAPTTAGRVLGCPTAALTVAALRGSGAAGHQYAFLQFTNKSGTTCSLTGFPGVQLLRGGTLLGKPATRANKPVTTVSLTPGRSATARLVDDSTCNAEKSDSVQIYPPNRTEKVVVPLAVRGCALTIDPVVAS